MKTKFDVILALGFALLPGVASAQYEPPVYLPVSGGPADGNLQRIVGQALDVTGSTPHPAAFFGGPGPLTVTDGTVAGTREIDTSSFLQIGDTAAIPGGVGAYLIATGDQTGQSDRLAITDGTSSGTHLIDELVTAVPEGIRKIHGFVQQSVVFETHADRLVVSDGTLAGTYTLLPGGAGTYIQEISFGSTQGFVYAYDDLGGHIWRFGPALADKQEITPAVTPPFYSRFLTAFGDRACFDAGSQTIGDVSGAGLYCSDGTPAGTQLIATSTGGEPFVLTDDSGSQKFGSKMYFVPIWKPFVGSPDTYSSPWVTDGTAMGTYRLPQILVMPWQRFGTQEGRVFFSGYPQAEGNSFWASEGAQSGTFEILRAPWSVALSYETDQTNPEFSSAAFFVTVKYTGPGSEEVKLRRTDGTETGTFPMPPPIGVADADWEADVDARPARLGNYLLVIGSSPDTPSGFWSYHLDPILTGSFD